MTDGLRRWPDGSLCEMSVLLAARFGGTPAYWREQAYEEDWGTALTIMHVEHEAMEGR